MLLFPSVDLRRLMRLRQLCVQESLLLMCLSPDEPPENTRDKGRPRDRLHSDDQVKHRAKKHQKF